MVSFMVRIWYFIFFYCLCFWRLSLVINKFYFIIFYGDGWIYIRILGVIDEDNCFCEFSREVCGDLLMVDLFEVEWINFCGVCDWVSWFEVVVGSWLEMVLFDIFFVMVV